jgi:hypothetical protein
VDIKIWPLKSHTGCSVSQSRHTTCRNEVNSSLFLKLLKSSNCTNLEKRIRGLLFDILGGILYADLPKPRMKTMPSIVQLKPCAHLTHFA